MGCGLFGVWIMELWILIPFELNMIFMDFGFDCSIFWCREKRERKGENCQISYCVQAQPSNRDTEWLNVALEHLNARIPIRLGQKAETSNVRTSSMNVRMLESTCPKPKTRRTKRSNSGLERSNVQCTLVLMAPFELIWLYIYFWKLWHHVWDFIQTNNLKLSTWILHKNHLWAYGILLTKDSNTLYDFHELQ